MPIDDATMQFLAHMQAADAPPLETMTPDQARALGPILQQLYGSGPDMKSVRQVTVPTSVGDVPVRVFSPNGTSCGVIVYLHGGGWVLGTLDDYDTLARQLASLTACTVVVVDYPLAPEHPHPAAVLAAHAVTEWVAQHLDDLAEPNCPLIVMGDSAGGNLAAVIAQLARTDGPDIALQVLIYPVTDSDTDTRSYSNPDNQLFLTGAGMRWFWDHYAPRDVARTDPLLAPLRAPDLSGLPPAIVLTAEYDVLRDEGDAYADRLRAAGVPVESRRFLGQMHMFFTLVNILPGAAAAMSYVASRVQAHLLLAQSSQPSGSSPAITTPTAAVSPT